MDRPANSDADRALIEAAREVIVRNYDAARKRHTVGAALRTASGEVFVGVNVYSLHGSCAEFVAIGAAISAGHREFVSLAAVRGNEGAELLPPCGNCRQILVDYAPSCEILVAGDDGPIAVPVVDLLPYAYEVE